MSPDDAPTESEDGESPAEEIVFGAVSAITFLVGFGLMFAGVQFFWVAFVVGFAGVLPMALGIVNHYQQKESNAEEMDTGAETEDALEELRQRYARGEFTDEEFERRVERLLETETVSDAREHAERFGIEHTEGEQAERTDAKNRTGERERELERE